MVCVQDQKMREGANVSIGCFLSRYLIAIGNYFCQSGIKTKKYKIQMSKDVFLKQKQVVTSEYF